MIKLIAGNNKAGILTDNSIGQKYFIFLLHKMEKEIFKKIQPTIPTEPGIYQYFDEKGILLYVGKAKNLRNRVSSYFSSKQLTLKTIELVQKIKDIQKSIKNLQAVSKRLADVSNIAVRVLKKKKTNY